MLVPPVACIIPLTSNFCAGEAEPMPTLPEVVARLVAPVTVRVPNVPLPVEAEIFPLEAVILPLLTVRPEGNVVIPFI